MTISLFSYSSTLFIILKIFFNNFIAKKQFMCPKFLNMTMRITHFSHIEKVYKLEYTKPVKIAHKLNDKVLSPTTIEKTNVKLADAVFKSLPSMHCTFFFGKNGYPEFIDAANFLKIIRKMWNITNVKSPGIGKAKRDSTREPIEECSAEQLDYLLNFASWIKDWNSKTTRSLTIQTIHWLFPDMQSIG